MKKKLIKLLEKIGLLGPVKDNSEEKKAEIEQRKKNIEKWVRE